MVKSRDYMVARLMAWDIVRITERLSDGDVGYLSDILLGEGWTQYGNMDTDSIESEYREQEESGRFVDIEKNIQVYPAHVQRLIRGKLHG